MACETCFCAYVREKEARRPLFHVRSFVSLVNIVHLTTACLLRQLTLSSFQPTSKIVQLNVADLAAGASA
jgi:hypothetical protein